VSLHMVDVFLFTFQWLVLNIFQAKVLILRSLTLSPLSRGAIRRRPQRAAPNRIRRISSRSRIALSIRATRSSLLTSATSSRSARRRRTLLGRVIENANNDRKGFGVDHGP
jgi:hypothetical protein